MVEKSHISRLKPQDRVRKRLNKVPKFWFAASVVTFILGVVLPAYEIYPGTKNIWFDAVLGAVTGQDLTPQTKSILGTILELFDSQSPLKLLLGVLLAAFSIGFPAAKYACLIHLAISQKKNGFVQWYLKWGYFSMVEVFVVAILVAALIPHIDIIPQIGLVPFTFSVFSAWKFHKQLETFLGEKKTNV